jgi:hypothetical protein
MSEAIAGGLGSQEVLKIFAVGVQAEVFQLPDLGCQSERPLNILIQRQKFIIKKWLRLSEQFYPKR